MWFDVSELSTGGHGESKPKRSSRTLIRLRKFVKFFRKGMDMSIGSHGTYFEVSGPNDKCHACAVGTYLLGAGEYQIDGIDHIAYPTLRVNEMLPGVAIPCPISRCGAMAGRGYVPDDYVKGMPLPLGTLAEHLFEFHEWNRGKLARWFEGKIAKMEADEKIKV